MEFWNPGALERSKPTCYLDLGTLEPWLLGCEAELITHGIACICLRMNFNTHTHYFLHCPDKPRFAKEHLGPLAVSVSGPRTFQGSRASQNAEHFAAVASPPLAYKLQEFLRGPGKCLCPN